MKRRSCNKLMGRSTESGDGGSKVAMSDEMRGSDAAAAGGGDTGDDYLHARARGAAASHARPRNEVVDLDSRSVLPSGAWGLVVGFRRRGLVR